MPSRYAFAIAALAAAASSTGASAQIDTDALEAKIATDPAPPGKNVEGGSVFTNFARAYNEGQLFFTLSGVAVYEKPGTEPVSVDMFHWCGDLSFSDISDNSTQPMAYAGRCVTRWLTRSYDGMMSVGAQLAGSDDVWMSTYGISATFVEQLNIFRGDHHTNHDDYHWVFWDDGRRVTSDIGFESHDEGDMSPNAATSSVSNYSTRTWLSTDEAVSFLNVTADELTPGAFKEVYAKAWTKSHEEEAVVDNPDAESELEVIADVKNETFTYGTPEADAEDAAEDSSSSKSGRKLASATARVVSAVFRMFGI